MRRLHMAVLLVTLLVTGPGVATPAAAQTGLWEFTATTGGWWGRPDSPATTQPFGDDEWFGAWAGSFSVGRYWTDHIKTELDATFTSSGDRYINRQIVLPGERTPRFFSTEEHRQERSIAALVTLQAGRNWWVHPFLQGGVSVDWDHVQSEIFPVFIGSIPVVPPGFEPIDETRAVARGIVAGGAKFYMTEHSFFRADVRTSFGSGQTHVQLRTGFGIDF